MHSLVQRLELNAARAATAEALVHGTERLSYGELWRRVLAFSACLRQQGLAPQARVALLLENSSAYVVAYYGALAAGGVVVALNSSARAADLLNWIAHSEASWLVMDVNHPASTEIQSACRERVKRVTVNGEHAGALAWPTVLETPALAPLAIEVSDLPAAIIYTSGTTGQPKGVTLSHRNLAANTESILSYLALGEGDRIVNILPFYYSYGNSVLHTHLAAGGCVIIEDNLVYPHRVIERMVAERATGFAGVPSTFALLLSRVKFAEYRLEHLRYVTQAGGAMSAANIRRFQDVVPQARFVVMYGQTEATARLSYLPAERLHDKAGSVGVAIPGVTLDVRDEHGEPVGPNVVGEIWARGENIMLGYWRDAPSSARVLQDGWLKTGDMAHRDADGFFYIEGRRSDMIKTGAHRIHPAEIEEALVEFDGVAEAAAVGVPDDILGQVIKAYVVARAGVTLDPMRVKAHCRERLASYKIPKFLEFVPALPKTASGKIKRFLLAAN